MQGETVWLDTVFALSKLKKDCLNKDLTSQPAPKLSVSLCQRVHT